MSSLPIQSPVLCGECFEATDGTLFYPARLCNNAGRNIGIVEEKGKEKTLYPDMLYNVASAAALKMMNAYEEAVNMIHTEVMRNEAL